MAHLFVYAIALAAVSIPAFLAWRYRAKAAALETQIAAERGNHALSLEKLNYEKDQIKQEFENYRHLVENNPSTPRAVIKQLREQGKITG